MIAHPQSLDHGTIVFLCWTAALLDTICHPVICACVLLIAVTLGLLSVYAETGYRFQLLMTLTAGNKLRTLFRAMSSIRF